MAVTEHPGQGDSHEHNSISTVGEGSSANSLQHITAFNFTNNIETLHQEEIAFFPAGWEVVQLFPGLGDLMGISGGWLADRVEEGHEMNR